MEKEEAIIKEVAANTADLSVALDLGSGTGRDAIVLSKRFEQVFGYDFSRGMVNVAGAQRLKDRHGNVAYKLLDLEVELLAHGNGTVGLVDTGFGMASFLQTPGDLLKEIRRVLVPQGFAIFSFYNKDSYVRQLSLTWAPSLAAISDPDDECLHVTLPDQQTFKPSAKMYIGQSISWRIVPKSGPNGVKSFSICHFALASPYPGGALREWNSYRKFLRKRRPLLGRNISGFRSKAATPSTVNASIVTSSIIRCGCAGPASICPLTALTQKWINARITRSNS
jgi:SAM-dependent methyltransferase